MNESTSAFQTTGTGIGVSSECKRKPSSKDGLPNPADRSRKESVSAGDAPREPGLTRELHLTFWLVCVSNCLPLPQAQMAITMLQLPKQMTVQAPPGHTHCRRHYRCRPGRHRHRSPGHQRRRLSFQRLPTPAPTPSLENALRRTPSSSSVPSTSTAFKIRQLSSKRI